MAEISARRRHAVVWAWSLYSLALLGGSLVPGPAVPEVALLGWDKLGHAVAFAALSALTTAVAGQRKGWFWIVLGYGAAMGAATELLQSLVPERLASFWDWVADALGTLVCLLFLAVWRRRKALRREKRTPVRLTMEEPVRSRDA